MRDKKVFVVPHSHWDREWYFTIEDSNVLLVENLDYLMQVLEKDQGYSGYVFDAQASLVEEYLKIRPENKDRFQSLVADKRIFIGPWYTQADTLLVNKESIIRNLLYGTQISKQMGHSMEVGYLPDIFGQNAYLPSIFQGFGMEYSILQRGIYTDQLNGNLNFHWKSPDGKTVKANNLYLGYGPGKFLAATDEYLEDRLLPMLTKLADLNQDTELLLLPAGGDQVLVRKHFPETVQKLNEMDQKHEYVLSDYESFMKEVWAKDGRALTNEIEGELLGSQKSRIHNTIGSQRYDLKQLNSIVENKILYILEPLASMTKTIGFKYPDRWLDHMWKQLFDVHAHDSIGGCNSDDTNADILHRLEKVNRIADGLINIVKKQITEAISQKLGKNNIMTVFNTRQTDYSGVIEAIVFTKEKGFDIKGVEGFQVTAQDYISGGKKIVVTAEGEKEVEVPGYFRSVLEVQVKNLPSMGYSTYEIIEGGREINLLQIAESTNIANEFFEIAFVNGALSIKEKVTQTNIEGFLTFEDIGDAGDSYDFSPMEKEIRFSHAELIRVEKVSLSEKMTLKHHGEVPRNLQEREQGKATGLLEILTTLELRRDEEMVRIHHEIENAVKDHRVRVILRTPVENPEVSFADQAFSSLTRNTVNPYLNNWRENGFAEAPVPVYPLENFAGVTGNKGTMAVITKGLKEYEVLPETSELALTLYRSVGLLGRDDLKWRPGRASGINNKVVYTPAAQLQKQLAFDYAVYFSSEAMREPKMFALVDCFIGHYAAYQKQSLNTFEERLERFEIPYSVKELPPTFSLFKVTNPNVFMSTCKQAFDGIGLVLRLFNPGERDEQTEFVSDLFEQVIKTDLSEQPIDDVESALIVPAKGYITLKLISKGAIS
jgi:alpha-mannosidase